jgi:hypothetical protein
MFIMALDNKLITIRGSGLFHLFRPTERLHKGFYSPPHEEDTPNTTETGARWFRKKKQTLLLGRNVQQLSSFIHTPKELVDFGNFVGDFI